MIPISIVIFFTHDDNLKGYLMLKHILLFFLDVN